MTQMMTALLALCFGIRCIYQKGQSGAAVGRAEDNGVKVEEMEALRPHSGYAVTGMLVIETAFLPLMFQVLLVTLDIRKAMFNNRVLRQVCKPLLSPSRSLKIDMFLIDMHCFMNTNRVHTAHDSWILRCRHQLPFYLAERRSKEDFKMYLQCKEGMC
jgi:hypothetical protein